MKKLIAMASMLLMATAASGASLRRGSEATAIPTIVGATTTSDTVIPTGQSRTATLIFRNKYGQIVPAPAGTAIRGNSLALDGGQFFAGSSPTSVTVGVNSNPQVSGDYVPPRPAHLQVFVNIPVPDDNPNGIDVTIDASVAAVDSISSSLVDSTPATVELNWAAAK